MSSKIALTSAEAVSYSMRETVDICTSTLNQTIGDWHRDAHADRSRVVTSLKHSARSCCAEHYDSGDPPAGARPHAGRITPRPVWGPVSAPSVALVRRWVVFLY